MLHAKVPRAGGRGDLGSSHTEGRESVGTAGGIS